MVVTGPFAVEETTGGEIGRVEEGVVRVGGGGFETIPALASVPLLLRLNEFVACSSVAAMTVRTGSSAAINARLRPGTHAATGGTPPPRRPCSDANKIGGNMVNSATAPPPPLL